MNTTGINNTASPAGQKQQLRQAAEQLVSEAFLKTLMSMHRDSSLKGKYGHGGRGEEVFGSQLDTILAEESSSAMRSTLTDAVMRQLARDHGTPTIPDDATRHLEIRA